MQLNSKVIKVTTPDPFLHQPPPFQGYSPFLANFNKGGGGRFHLCGRPNLIFLLTKIGFAPWPDINVILLTINLPFDSDVRQGSHPFMIQLHYLWAKSNNKTRSQWNVTWIGFVFVLTSFVQMHGGGCCSIVSLRFQAVQIKQVDCKTCTKNVNNYK